MFDTRINIVTCGNAAGWESAARRPIGTIQWSDRGSFSMGEFQSMPGPVGLPTDFQHWPAKRQIFVASLGEGDAARADEVISFLRRNTFDLIVCESLFGARESSDLKSLSASKSSAFRSVNRIAVACTHLGYDLSVGWIDHEAIGSSVSRSRFTAVLRAEGIASLGRPAAPLGWYGKVSAYAEPTPDPEYFEPCEPAPWQMERLTRQWWGKTPIESDEPFMVHSKYSGGTSVFKVSPIRWGHEPAYIPHGRVLVRLGKSFYAARRPAIARICGYIGPDMLAKMPDKQAVDLMSEATSPDAAMAIMYSNLEGV